MVQSFSMLEIITVPNPILRKKSTPIEDIDKKLLSFFENLGETLIHKSNPPGVGISAVQVGKPIRAFYTLLPKDYKDGDDFKNPILQLYINPSLSKVSEEMTIGKNKRSPIVEGCLSIPLIYGAVPRHEWVEITYQQLNRETLKLTEKTEQLFGFTARVIQHEYDHLEGTLFTDHNQKEALPLFFEQEDELVKIKNPQEILTW